MTRTYFELATNAATWVRKDTYDRMLKRASRRGHAPPVLMTDTFGRIKQRRLGRAMPRGVMSHSAFVGHSHSWTGKQLRKMRAKNGVGRPV